MSGADMIALCTDILVASSNLLILSAGLFVIYGLFRVVNMAHGDMVMTGAYAASLAQQNGAGFAFAALGASLISAALALVMERLCIGRLRERSAMSTLLATWGFGLIISQSIRLTLGSGGRFVTPAFEGTVSLLGVVLPAQHILLAAVALVLAALGTAVLRGTRLGLALRAHIADPNLCELNGIDTRQLFSFSFVLGGALAGLAGALVAPLSAINPSSGSGFAVASFMVVISGGLGNILSPIRGALFVGGVRSILNALTSTTGATLGTLALVGLVLVIRGRLGADDA